MYQIGVASASVDPQLLLREQGTELASSMTCDMQLGSPKVDGYEACRHGAASSATRKVCPAVRACGTGYRLLSWFGSAGLVTSATSDGARTSGRTPGVSRACPHRVPSNREPCGSLRRSEPAVHPLCASPDLPSLVHRPRSLVFILIEEPPYNATSEARAHPFADVTRCRCPS